MPVTSSIGCGSRDAEWGYNDSEDIMKHIVILLLVITSTTSVILGVKYVECEQERKKISSVYSMHMYLDNLIVSCRDGRAMAVGEAGPPDAQGDSTPIASSYELACAPENGDKRK
jgi:hypothetical protein